MLLCADIDFSAKPSGEVGPGSRLLSQVWAKRVDHDGTTAILMINADSDAARNVTVELDALGLDSLRTVRVRDLWAKRNVGSLVPQASRRITKSIPPQDSVFLKLIPG